MKNTVFHKIRKDFYRVEDTENFSAANYFSSPMLLNY